MLCGVSASCTIEEGQVWIQAGNELTLECCLMISTALTARALPALMLLPLLYYFGNWLSFPNSQVSRGLQSGTLMERVFINVLKKNFLIQNFAASRDPVGKAGGLESSLTS